MDQGSNWGAGEGGTAETLAARLKTLRLQRGLTQQELAAGICDRSFLSLVEHGRATPSLYCLRRLAQRLGVDAELLASRDSAPTERGEVRRLIAAGRGRLAAGDAAGAVALCADAARRAEVAGLQDLAAQAYEDLAEAHLTAGNPGAAIDAADRAIPIRQADGDATGLARAYQLLGRSHLDLDVPEEALRCFRRGLDFLAGVGEAGALRASLLCHIARTHHRLGGPDEVARSAEAAIKVAREAGDRFWLAWATWVRAIGRRQQGHTDAARRDLAEAARLFARIGHEPGIYACGREAALIEADRGRWRHALAELDACTAYLRRQEMWPDLAFTLAEVARARVALGDAAGARAACQEGLAVIPAGEHLPIRARLYAVLADVCDAEGRLSLAAAYRRASQELRAAAGPSAARPAPHVDVGIQATGS